MSQVDHAGRIPRNVFTPATITLFSISIFFAISRIIIRLHYQKRLFVDDIFLAIAVACLCATMVLLLYYSSSLYLMEALTEGLLSSEFSSTTRVNDQLHAFKSVYRGIQFGSLNATFSVKFNFLFFFRNLILHLDNVFLYWRIILMITTLAWVYCTTINFISCGDCLSRSNSLQMTGFGASGVALDIITDLLIVAIPIYLVRKIQLQLRRKIALGASLCLPIVMIIIATVLISSLHAGDKVDFTWFGFWLFVEACVAVTMVSLISFRSLYVVQTQRKAVHSSPKPRWIRNPKRPLELSSSIRDEDMQALPAIPRRATLAVPRTLIRNGSSASERGTLDESFDGIFHGSFEEKERI